MIKTQDFFLGISKKNVGSFKEHIPQWRLAGVINLICFQPTYLPMMKALQIASNLYIVSFSHKPIATSV